jgi:hypothetical protein
LNPAQQTTVLAGLAPAATAQQVADARTALADARTAAGGDAARIAAITDTETQLNAAHPNP